VHAYDENLKPLFEISLTEAPSSPSDSFQRRFHSWRSSDWAYLVCGSLRSRRFNPEPAGQPFAVQIAPPLGSLQQVDTASLPLPKFRFEWNF
jgi:hypothetical protein